MSTLYTDRQRALRESQLRIKHYCRCDPARVFVGNGGRNSHRRANLDHTAATYREHLAARDGGAS